VRDTDCKGDRICVDGRCQSPASAPEQAPTGYSTYPPAGRGRGASAVVDDRYADLPDSNFGIQADIGGFVCYGPAINVEFGIGRRVAIYGEARAIGLGALRWAIAGDTDGVHNSVGLTDYGIGGGVRIFFGHKANREGLYVGGLGDYVSTHSYSDATGSHPALDYHSTGLLLAATVGYRWVFSSRLTLGAGGALGGIVKLDATATVRDSSEQAPSGYLNTFNTSAGGLLTLELGFAL
jgi:hypothetical protein